MGKFPTHHIPMIVKRTVNVKKAYCSTHRKFTGMCVDFVTRPGQRR